MAEGERKKSPRVATKRRKQKGFYKSWCKGDNGTWKTIATFDFNELKKECAEPTNAWGSRFEMKPKHHVSI